MSQNIQVAVRCRPLNEKEKKDKSYSVIECNERRREIVALANSMVSNTKTFTYDKVFGCESKQAEVYNQVVRPVVKEVLEGYNCTIFAYGQTGTGKTYTMEGDHSVMDDNASWEDDPKVGIIPRSVAHLFSLLSSMSNCEHSVKISYMELYNEELTDLLSDSYLDKDEKLKIYDDPSRKGSVIVSKLEEIIVQNKNQVFKILQKGAERRQKAATQMNAQSSRSHSIFTITVFIKDKAIEGEETIKVGKLNLVDLAGSENIERSGATGKRAAEAGKINKSLTTLGRVITALVQHSDHIPYRESNLTRLLQDSLGGRTKTTIIATISPALSNLEETLSTLDYAHKAKSIRNKPEINQKLVKKELIKEYNEEIERLKRELNAAREKDGVYIPIEMYQEMESNKNMLKNELRDYIKKIASSSEELDKKNEENKKLQDELAEKNESLYELQALLAKSTNKNEKLEEDLRELNFLVSERFKSEERMLEQVRFLVHYKIELENENRCLHEKISRITSINDKNKTMANQFSQYINKNVSSLAVREHEILSLNKQTNCSLCELLSEIKSKLIDRNQEEIQQLGLFDKKLKASIESHQNLIEKELDAALKEHYEGFINTLSHQSSNLAVNCDDLLEVCQEHREGFMKIWTKMNTSIEVIAKDFVNFESNFCNLTNDFLVSHMKDFNESCSKINASLNHIAETIDSNRNEINDMIESKNNFKTEMIDSLSTIQEMLSTFGKKFALNFDQIGTKYSNLQEKNETDLKTLNDLKDFIKENDHKKIKKFNSDFELKINQPVKSFVETNSKNLIEMNVLTKSLHEKHDVITSHYSNSIIGLKMAEEENLKNCKEKIGSEFGQLEKICKKIQHNLNDFDSNNMKYLDKIQSQIRESETNINHKLNETLNITNEMKQSENLIEINRESCTKIFREASKFSDQDFEEYIPTGKSPKNKIYDTNFIIIEPKTNQELIESYKSIADIKNPKFFTPILSDSLIVSTSNANSTATDMSKTRINEVLHGQKRAISEKENQIDFGEKNSKIKRYFSNSRLQFK